MCISPLTSLMSDQKAKYSPRGLVVDFVGEAQTDASCKGRVLKGEVQLVFITPENIIDNRTYRDMLLLPVYQEKLVALVIDEAHCVKTWGDQFRRSFARIGDLRSLLPKNVNVTALTATATVETLDVVIQRLSMHNVYLVAMPPCQNNIFFALKLDLDTAFGMGVDCQDISRVMHYGAPSTLEEYITRNGSCRKEWKASQRRTICKRQRKIHHI